MEQKSTDNADEDNPSWREVLSQYTQDTSFHGWRYFGDPTPFFIRKILWLILVLGSLGGFGYIFYFRMVTFFKYEVNVNVGISHVSAITFPAVTICNQNFLRASQAQAKQVYDPFEYFFNVKEGTDIQNKEESVIMFEGQRMALVNKSYSSNSMCPPFYIEDGSPCPLSNFLVAKISYTTNRVCKYLCCQVEEYNCKSFLYHPILQTCWLLNDQLSMQNVSIAGVEGPALSLIDDHHVLGNVTYDYIHYYNKTSCGEKELFTRDDLMEKFRFDEYFDAKLEFDGRITHTKNDMIRSCLWEKLDCMDMIKGSMTDYGQCFTFNGPSPGEHPLTTVRTGSSSGLQLLINIEDYESMVGPNIDSGVKVYLHHQNELPMVRDLGFTVAPGMHALIGVKSVKAISIGKPWGNCSKMSLEYYEEKDYTWYRCQRDCETTRMVKQCGCRDMHMPGVGPNNPPYCDLYMYFHCVLEGRFDSEVMIEYNNCLRKCVMTCSRTVYEPVLSSASLSSLAVDTILSNDIIYYKNHLMSALNTQWRVRKEYFVPIAKALVKTRSMFTSYLRKLKEKSLPEYLVSNLETPLTRALKSLKDDIFTHDFEKVFLKDLDEIVKNINVVFRPNRDSLYRLLDLVKQNAKMVTLYVGNVIAFDGVYPELKTLVDETYNNVADAVTNLPIYQSMLKDVAGTLQKFGFQHMNTPFTPHHLSIVNSTCVKSFEDLESGLQNLSEALDEVIFIIDENKDYILFNNTPTNSSYKDNLKVYVGLIFGLIRQFEDNFDYARYSCMERYFAWQEKVKDFKTTFASKVGSLIKMDLRFDYEKESAAFLKDKTNIENMVKSFVDDNELSVENLLFERTTLDQMNAFIKVETDLISLTKLRTTETLRTVKSKVLNEIIDGYKTVIGFADDVGLFVSKDEVIKRLKEFRLWKRPKALVTIFSSDEKYQLANSTGFDYQECEDSFDVSELDFTVLNDTYIFGSIIKCQVDLFGVNIDKMLATSDAELDSQQQQLTTHLKALRDLMEDLRQSNKVDESFIKKNFLLMDIFFSELREEVITQNPAFGIEDLLGNIGGYMGLLLGASCMTLFEIIDLFLHTCCKKMMRKKGSRQASKVGPFGDDVDFEKEK